MTIARITTNGCPNTSCVFSVRTRAGQKKTPFSEIRAGLGSQFFICKAASGPDFIVDHSLFYPNLEAILGSIFSEMKLDHSSFKEDLKKIIKTAVSPALLMMGVNRDDEAKYLFEDALKLAIDNVIHASRKEGVPHTGVIKHYIFMINQAANAGADIATTAAILLHNLDENRAKMILRGSLSVRSRALADEALRIRKLFLRLNKAAYRPFNTGEPRFFMQNFMNALICIAEGEGRALLMHLIHKLSNLDFLESIDALTARKYHEIYAPLAERIGLNGLSAQLHNLSLQLEDTESYLKISDEIETMLEIFGFRSMDHAYQYLTEIECSVREMFTNNPVYRRFGLVSVRSRVKNIWSIYCKIKENNGYQEITDLKDLFAVEIVTREPLPANYELDQSIMIALEATRGKYVDLNFDDMQTETKLLKTHDGQVKKKIHVAVVCKSPGSSELDLEIQIMDQAAYQLVTFGEKAHWQYKAAKYYELNNPGKRAQRFDLCDLLQYSDQLNGNYLNDTKVIYEHIMKKWVYVFYMTSEIDKEPGVLRVLRLPKGSVPYDGVAVMRRHAGRYKGLKIKKIWMNEYTPAGETREFENGDIFEFLDGRGIDIKKKARDILHHLKSLRAKYFYYTTFINTRLDAKAAAREGYSKLTAAYKTAIGPSNFDKNELNRLLLITASKLETVFDNGSHSMLLIILGIKDISLIKVDEVVRQMVALRGRV
ncbi:MAG: hypothetical protein ABIJ26_03865 [Candidatus Margulisiibacteriota bacterium]